MPFERIVSVPGGVTLVVRALAGFAAGVGLMILGLSALTRGLGVRGMSRFQRLVSSYRGGTAQGVLWGAVLTASIQSSSAATILLVGMVDSGLLTLPQAIPLVLGANLGTTLTGQFLARNPFGHRSGMFAIILLAGGALLHMLRLAKSFPRRGEHQSANVSTGPGKEGLETALLGAGLIFMGIDILNRALSPLGDEPWFTAALLSFSGSPWTALAAGVVLTAIVMSSSVTVGILQRFADQSLVSLPAAVFMMAGDDLGTTADTLLVGMLAGRQGRALALAHFLFNLFNLILVLLFHPLFTHIVNLSAASPAQKVANAHTLFNLIGVLFMSPFVRALASASLLLSIAAEKCRRSPCS